MAITQCGEAVTVLTGARNHAPSLSIEFPIMRGAVFQNTTLAAVLVVGSAAAAASAHPCSDAAAEQARKLLAFHFGSQVDSGQLIEIDKSVTELSPIHNPANNQQMLDVLEMWAYIYKGQYRMRFIYARIPGECALIGQEILEYASF